MDNDNQKKEEQLSGLGWTGSNYDSSKSDAMVTFTEAVVNGYNRMFVTDECATRAEFWWWQLYNILLIMGIGIIVYCVSMVIAEFFSHSPLADLLSIIGVIAAVILYCIHLIAGITITVRRLHDSNHSGAHWFWQLIPYIGPLILFAFMIMPSDPDSQWRDYEFEE